jgi:hypothetical protein
VTAAQKTEKKGKKRRNDEIEANDNAIINSSNNTTINSSPSAGPSTRTSKRARRS